MIAAAALAWGGAVFLGLFTRDSTAGLVMAFGMGMLVTCALSSSLAFIIAARHWLLLVAALSLVSVVAAIALGWTPVESLAKVLFATSAGLWMSLLLTSIGQVVIIAVLIVFVDFYSVFLGPTHRMVESGSAWVDYLTIKLPVFGAPGVSQLGTSDIVFFSLFIGVSITYALRRSATALALTASFVATMVVGVSLGMGVPALPLLSVFFLLGNADLLYERFLREPEDH